MPAVHTQFTPSARPVAFFVGSNSVFSISPSSATIYAAARMKTVSQPLPQRTRSSRIRIVPAPYSRRFATSTNGFKYGDEPLTYSAVSGAKKNRNPAGGSFLMPQPNPVPPEPGVKNKIHVETNKALRLDPVVTEIFGSVCR